jgi:hypothetical protein
MPQIGNITVDSQVWWAPSGITLQAGQDYRFQASGEWFDAQIACGPDGYNLSAVSPLLRPLFKIFSGLRPLDTGDQWYMLIGRIGTQQPFKIGSSLSKTVSNSGQLYLTVNDIHAMYYNNRGKIDIQIFT